jgi:hypothetical protein
MKEVFLVPSSGVVQYADAGSDSTKQTRNAAAREKNMQNRGEH